MLYSVNVANIVTDIYDTIVNGFTTIIDFITIIFNDLVMLGELLAYALGNIPSFFTWLPSEVVSVLVIGLSVAVVYMFIGRK